MFPNTWLNPMLLREKLAGAPIYTFCWWTLCVCASWILSDCDLWEVRVFESTVLWHSITLTWKMSNCGSWGGKPGKKMWLPQGDHRSLTHISCLISDWYDRVVAVLLTLVHFLFQDGYHCQTLSLVLSLCRSRGSILLSLILLFVLVLRLVVSAQILK